MSYNQQEQSFLKGLGEKFQNITLGCGRTASEDNKLTLVIINRMALMFMELWWSSLQQVLAMCSQAPPTLGWEA